MGTIEVGRNAEKFENLYKYYKKTKDGKAGRQDGKNYRFFRQLEAIISGESASPSCCNNLILRHDQASNYNPYRLDHQNKPFESVSNFSISNNNSSHELETSSTSENNEEYGQSNDNTRSRRLGWREKVKAFVDSQMRKVMGRQETWTDNVLKTIEQREQERAWREIEWRKQETARFDREHEFWAKERAWIEARDAALMEAFKNFIGNSGHDDNLMINTNLSSVSKARLLAEMDRSHGN